MLLSLVQTLDFLDQKFILINYDFWIGFFIMFFNEGFVMMRHVSPWAQTKGGRFNRQIWSGMANISWYA